MTSSSIITTFALVTSNTTVSSVSSSTATITTNETASEDLEKELNKVVIKAERLMLDLVAELEEIPEIVR